MRMMKAACSHAERLPCRLNDLQQATHGMGCTLVMFDQVAFECCIQGSETYDANLQLVVLSIKRRK